jgi:outer membrane protein assembly factor BamB
VYIGSYDHHLYALDEATGDILWSAVLGGKIYSSPAVVDGRVYIATQLGRVWAFGLRNPPHPVGRPDPAALS